MTDTSPQVQADAPQVNVNAVEVEEDRSPEASLAQGAVTAAALSGVAAAKADSAETTAQVADAKADVALAQNAAIAEGAVTRDEAHQIAREEVDTGMSQLAKALRPEVASPGLEAPPPEQPPEPEPDKRPESVERAGTKRSVADRYLGRSTGH